MSHFSLYYFVLRLKISGAINPGVPHILNKAFFSFINAANPKSIILN